MYVKKASHTRSVRYLLIAFVVSIAGLAIQCCFGFSPDCYGPTVCQSYLRVQLSLISGILLANCAESFPFICMLVPALGYKTEFMKYEWQFHVRIGVK